LLTVVTTASSTSPLKGLNTRQLYVTSNVARPEPSLRIRPCARRQGAVSAVPGWLAGWLAGSYAAGAARTLLISLTLMTAMMWPVFALAVASA
jgi:hypothetical protein